MSFLLAEELDDRLAPCAERVTGIKDVDNDVGRVKNLVQFSPDTTRCTLGVNRLTRKRDGRVIGLRRKGLTGHIGG